MSGELVRAGSEVMLGVLPGDLTVAGMRARLQAEIDARPEITNGIVLEVWFDGRMRATWGGILSAPRAVTTIEYPSPDSRDWIVP